jgi:hypothetical protein
MVGREMQKCRNRTYEPTVHVPVCYKKMLIVQYYTCQD